MTGEFYEEKIELHVDDLSEAGISRYLRHSGDFHVEVRKTVTSTNTILKDASSCATGWGQTVGGLPGGGLSEGRLPDGGLPEWYVLVAEEQTAGKGRMGRPFHSPSGHGLYFSVLLRPGNGAFSASPHDDGVGRAGSGNPALLITSVAAVAAARAIQEVTGIRVGIKWVNDLLIGGKKVCGILTEAVIRAGSANQGSAQDGYAQGGEAWGSGCPGSGYIDSIVVGFGINVIKPKNGYPEALEDIATALYDGTEAGTDAGGAAAGNAGNRKTGVNSTNANGAEANISPAHGVERCRLIAATLDYFRELYEKLPDRGFLDEYRDLSVLPGKEITIYSGAEHQTGRVIAIDDDCGLVVHYANGQTVTINSGEVSVRERV